MYWRVVKHSKRHRDMYMPITTPGGTAYLKVYCTIQDESGLYCTSGKLVSSPGGYSGRVPKYAQPTVDLRLAEWELFDEDMRKSMYFSNRRSA